MRKLIFMVVAMTMTSMAISQTASPDLVSSSGDSFSNATYQLDWSVGECITATHTAGDYVITQGFHQNTYVITAVENLRPEIEMTVYPNPTNDIVSLKVESSKVYPVGNSNRVESMQYTITDLSGKVLQTDEIQSDLEQINFSNYAVGTYLISISQNNQLIKSFQIIKN